MKVIKSDIYGIEVRYDGSNFPLLYKILGESIVHELEGPIKNKHFFNDLRKFNSSKFNGLIR